MGNVFSSRATPEERRKFRAFLMTTPALALLSLVLLIPIFTIIYQSFTLPTTGFQNYLWFFNTDINVTVLIRTFKVALIVTVLCTVIAYPYAYAMSVLKPQYRILLILCTLVPLWASDIVRTFAWIIILQNSGVFNSILEYFGFEKVRLIRTQTGVMIGMVQILLPFMIMPLYSVMRGINLDLIKASCSLGASPLVSFFKIYLPLSLPGVFSGATIVFILATGFYITPLLLGGPTSTLLSTLVQQQISSLLNWGHGGAMSVVLLILTFGCLLAVTPFMRRKRKSVNEDK
ncbi:MAG: ABC transporter permease [Gibbsiella quercinecans]|uniref:ABC transporter permease n=1 Tax=Gibbsiella quercinecans TaxID=929813 RepID=UPI003F3956FB